MSANQMKPNNPRLFKSFARSSLETFGETPGDGGCVDAPPPALLIAITSGVAVGAGVDGAGSGVTVGVGSGVSGVAVGLTSGTLIAVKCFTAAGVGVDLTGDSLTEAAAMVTSISNVLVVGRRHV